MIPKKIHYCWLSGDPFPASIAKCIESWKIHLPDYEFVLWDTNRFNLEDNIWVKQAFEAKKYAFAADYIRLYAVYHHGGIYMDTDVEVVKSFDDLLQLPYFAGTEGNGVIEAGVFGAEKGMPWLRLCLDYYENRSFITADGSFDIMTLPRIMMSSIEKKYKIRELPAELLMAEVSNSPEKNFLMFPQDYFCAKNQGTGLVNITENTYCIHHFAMSWISKDHTFLPDLKRKLMRFFGVDRIHKMIGFLRLRELRQLIRNIRKNF